MMMMVFMIMMMVVMTMVVMMMMMMSFPPRAHLDRMKSKEGAVVDEECPTTPLLSGDIFLMGNLVEAEQSSDVQDFDLSYGGLIVATGVVLAKPFILAFF